MQIENKNSFIPDNPRIAIVTVISSQISGHRNEEETTHSLYELEQLLDTLKLDSKKNYIQRIKHIDSAHVIGEGKMLEIKEDAEIHDFNLLVFDIELSATQHRNIQQTTGLVVIDRNMIILEIFARHARSKDAKMQIEIAKLEYFLPRMHSVWFRDKTVKSGYDAKMRKGETPKELERRLVKERIAHYKKESEIIEKNLLQQKKKREENTLLAALVGYTNAGKSSLMNRLCQEEVLEEDKLFATVDATFRTLSVHFKPPIVMIDTVGFISNLPTQLIKGFRTTLASAQDAHYLIIVSDISHKNCREQLLVTLNVLAELGTGDKPKLIVFNKKDRISENPDAENVLKDYPNHLLVSSFNPEDVEGIKVRIVQHFHSVQKEMTLTIPYSDGLAHSKVMELFNVIHSENNDEGISYRVSVNPTLLHLEILKKYNMKK